MAQWLQEFWFRLKNFYSSPVVKMANSVVSILNEGFHVSFDLYHATLHLLKTLPFGRITIYISLYLLLSIALKSMSDLKIV